MNGFLSAANLWNIMPAALDGITVIEQAAHNGGCRSYTNKDVGYWMKDNGQQCPKACCRQ